MSIGHHSIRTMGHIAYKAVENIKTETNIKD